MTLEEEDKPRGLRARLRGLAVRARSTVRDMLFDAITAPSVEITYHDATLDEDEEREPEETPIDQAFRIRKEYLEGLERFTEQRRQWREMFEESWPHHLAAQRMLERILEDGRAQLADLAKIVNRELGSTHVGLSKWMTPGAPPVGMADAYALAMKQIVENVADIDVAAERARILDDVDVTVKGPVADTRALNRKLFALIREVENERNVWNERSRAEQAQHNEIQGKLQTAVEAAAQVHGTLLAAVNSKRAEQKREPLRTREDLRKAAEEA